MSENPRPKFAFRHDDLARFLIENATDYAIFMLDAAGRVATWNSGAERILGYEEAEIIGRHFSCFFTPEDVRDGKPDEELRKTDASGRTTDDRWHVRKNGKRIWCNGVTHLLPDRDGHGYVKVMRDLTEKKLGEDRLRDVSDQLRKRTDELAGAAHRKDEFLAMLAHELRNPLAPIL